MAKKSSGFRVQGLGVKAAGALVLLAIVAAARGDGQRLWMDWGVTRADAGRPRLQSEATGGAAAWSVREVLRPRVALRTTATPATVESIPMPIAPGSRVQNVEIPAETAIDIVKPTWK